MAQTKQDEAVDHRDDDKEMDTMTQYTVSQTFETLGESCQSTHRTKKAAEAAASALRTTITDMVAGWDALVDDDAMGGIGCTNEIEAWNDALVLANGGQVYGRKAGRYIADLAVQIETRER